LIYQDIKDNNTEITYFLTETAVGVIRQKVIYVLHNDSCSILL